MQPELTGHFQHRTFNTERDALRYLAQLSVEPVADIPIGHRTTRTGKCASIVFEPYSDAHNPTDYRVLEIARTNKIGVADAYKQEYPDTFLFTLQNSEG